MARWHSCNVLRVGADRRHVWQFDARGKDFALGREHTAAAGESLPASVSKSWRSLWQPKLNIAWLPPGNAFVRLVHLPKSSIEETVSMVELQLEKLSPIPVTQMVWSLAVVPQTRNDNLQTVVVLFAERKAVEEFLGDLEGQGFLADRLEIPVLDELQAVAPSEDGAWIFPESVAGHNTALVGWWCGGTLQNLDLITLPATGDRAAAVKQQLTQIAWAGELEGWLTSPPTWHLVANDAVAEEWEPVLRQGLDQPIQIHSPATAADLAALTAKRAAAADAKSNLMPPEFATRYRQRFADRLWMRGLGAAVGLYLIGVVIYLLALGLLYFQTQSVEKEVAANGQSYTNAMEVRNRYQVLTERQELKYAALDCWKAVADVLPNEITLEQFNFSDGRKLILNGSAASGQDKAVLEFYEAMRNYVSNKQPLFDKAKGDALSYRSGPGGTVLWNFTLELKRAEML